MKNDSLNVLKLKWGIEDNKRKTRTRREELKNKIDDISSEDVRPEQHKTSESYKGWLFTDQKLLREMKFTSKDIEALKLEHIQKLSDKEHFWIIRSPQHCTDITSSKSFDKLEKINPQYVKTYLNRNGSYLAEDVFQKLKKQISYDLRTTK